MTSPNSKLAIDGGQPVRREPFRAWPVFDESDEQALVRALRSGRWGMGGDETDALEREFAASHGVKHAFTVPTGSAALEVALFAAGVGYGDEVIVPAYTFYATASACLMRGAIPVIADIEPGSYNLDPAAAEAAITPRTKALMPVHIGGCPADMDAFKALAKRHNLALIEDACQAHGAAWRGLPVGSVGDFGCFSFQSSKNISCGEGGMVTTNDDELAARCWSFKNYGRAPEREFYHHADLGTNFRISQFQSAVLRSQLARMEEFAEKRTVNGTHLAAGLREIGGLIAQEPANGVTRHAYHLFITRYDSVAFGGWPRQRFVEALAAEGIPCATGYGPLYLSRGIQRATLELKRALGIGGEADEYVVPASPVVEKACGEEGIWLLGQSALLGSRTDMDDVLKAVQLKIKKAAN